MNDAAGPRSDAYGVLRRSIRERGVVKVGRDAIHSLICHKYTQ